MVHWGGRTPGGVSVILFRDHAVLAVRGFAVAAARGTVSPRLPLRAELGARDDSDRGLHGWYNGLSAWAFAGVMPPEAPLPGKAVLYAANLGKKPQSLVVKGARRLVDGNTGEGKAPTLDLAVHDTFIGYLE